MNSELNHNISAYFSQSTESLYDFLIQNLYSPEKSPFLKRILLVPSPLMKNWLIKNFADKLGIAMGVELFLQEPGLKKIAGYLGMNSPFFIPSADQLTFAFQLLIPKLYEEYPFLHTYLEAGHRSRLLSLAEEMAELFIDYGTFGKTLLTEWKKSPKKHWQAALWDLLCKEFPLWGTAHQLFTETGKQPKTPFEVHLFAISYLPPVVTHFLKTLPVPVHFYHLSPTQTFWEDTLSHSQRRFLCKVWEEKGASDTQLETLQSYLRDTHPLLANWGKLGRMMVKQLPETLTHHEELYPLPAEIFERDEWNTLTYPDTSPIENTPLILLNQLQADLVTMRPPPAAPTISKNDGSIQVHHTPCKRREIEEIYNSILSIIGKHVHDECPITPEDIVVMAPDILDYAPYIQAHFEKEESVLHYRLMDIALPTHDPSIRAFKKILSLIHSRWESTTLKDLLYLEVFRARIDIDTEGISRLHKWIEDNQVIWGMDKKHHAESLTQSHCLEGIEVHQGTWEHFFERTLYGLMTAHHESVSLNEEDILPYPNIDLNDAELLGKWIEALKNLFKELSILEATQATLLEWAHLLEKLATNFLTTLSEQLETIFYQFRQVAIPFEDRKFSFDSILAWFENTFQKGKTNYREHHLNSIKFCSLLPMRAVPAKVVILCGMHDEAFPRIQVETSLNLLKEQCDADPKPKKIDFDRYLMLETVLSTRRYLIFTYSTSEENQGPSLIIQELLDLLDQYYTHDNGPLSSQLFFRHPFQRYNSYYFEGNPIANYTKTAYREAIAFLSEEKQPLKPFIERFQLNEASLEASEEVFLTLFDLELLARDPLGFYYKKTLGMTLKEKESLQSERLLSLSNLQASMIPRKALKGDLEREILLSKKRGELPEGIFEEIAKKHLNEKNQLLHTNLQNANVDPKTLFEYSFHHLPFFPILLSGTIENISSEGLVLHREGAKEDLYRFLPRIALFHFLVNEGLIASQPRLIFSESGKIQELTHPHPKEWLETYLHYWHQAKHNPSPFILKWISYLKNSDAEGLEKHLNNDFAISFSPYEKATKNFDLHHLMSSPWIEWSRRLYDSIV